MEPFLDPEEGIDSTYHAVYEFVGSKLVDCTMETLSAKPGTADLMNYDDVSAIGGSNFFARK